MKLIALKAMHYGARMLRVGEAFEASERDARILLEIGSARRDEAAPEKRRYKRRDMRAES